MHRRSFQIPLLAQILLIRGVYQALVSTNHVRCSAGQVVVLLGCDYVITDARSKEHRRLCVGDRLEHCTVDQ